jgi:hypothetical protein
MLLSSVKSVSDTGKKGHLDQKRPAGRIGNCGGDVAQRWWTTSAQLFTFGGFQARPQPQRGGGWFGGGWFGNNTFDPFQQRAPQPGMQLVSALAN